MKNSIQKEIKKMDSRSFLIVLSGKGNEHEIIEARNLSDEQKDLICRMLFIDEVLPVDEETEQDAMDEFRHILESVTKRGVREPISHDEVVMAQKEFPVILLTEGTILGVWDSAVQLAAENAFYTRKGWRTNVDDTEKWSVAAAYPIAF